jgi:hypothetical protein
VWVIVGGCGGFQGFEQIDTMGRLWWSLLGDDGLVEMEKI